VTGSLTLLQSQSALKATGLALVELARHAWTSRQVDLLNQAVSAILALPLDQEVHNVAHYYSAYALGKAGDSDQTTGVLDRLIDTALPQHKPRIIVGLAGRHLVDGKLTESTKIYLEACRASADLDPLSKSQALRGLALIRSLNGDHSGSVADLERLFPVMRSLATSYPDDYRYYLNNLAYELGQVGRIDEAKAAINVALRSPNAHRFPDWAETAQELETMPRRVFLPLVFALGSPAVALSVLASIEAREPAPVIEASPESAVAATRPEQVEPEASAPAQPESKPVVQISPARRLAPSLRRNLKTSIPLVLAWVLCRRVVRATPLRRTLIPSFETRGWGKSPRARSPPLDHSLF